MIERNNFLSRAAADMLRDAAALEKATLIQYSIKAGENFLKSQRGRANYGALALWEH